MGGESDPWDVCIPFSRFWVSLVYGIAEVRRLVSILAAGSLVFFYFAVLSSLPVAAQLSTEDHSGYIGNQACAKCHAPIYESYMRTAMASASGPATESLIAGEFTHKPSGVHYKVASEDGKVWLTFGRLGDPFVHDKREFLYYIGHGRRGRTYFFSTDGFVFESPVNWYADSHLWDMAPGYGASLTMPLNLPATTSCMGCHVSGVRAPLPGTDNRYPDPPFFFYGVTCERCHGPGATHAQNNGPIINPAKLSPTLRDQVCMQCHLEGNAAIERAGKHIYDFKPGEDLSSYVRYYVLTGNVPPGLRATSQFEALAESACKKKSGDALTCSACHNPHESVAPENRVAFYRAKCIACHGEVFAAKHHHKQPDCVSCHMPASQSSDVAHTQVTDHRIPRIPQPPAAAATKSASSSALPTLIPFPATPDSAKDTRDLALAWQSIVTSGMTLAQSQTEQLLRAALRESPHDPALLLSLAYAVQRRGNLSEAAPLYQKTLALDPDSLEAANNLGAIEANQGHFKEALKLWQSAFDRAPAKSEIGMNLGRIYCASHQFDNARSTLLRVLRFNPDLPPAKQYLAALNSSSPSCPF
jgi:predicted CXXCH cytochrome family protein